jgi:hypothetical protein
MTNTRFPTRQQDMDQLVPRHLLNDSGGLDPLPLKGILMGPAKTGKTVTGLKILSYATGLDPETLDRDRVLAARKNYGEGMRPNILVLSTANEGHELYAGDLLFDVISPPDYHPKWIWQALQKAENMGYMALLVDSWSHFWEGTGGALDIVDRQGGKFSAWQSYKETERIMLRALDETPLDVLLTIRTKDTVEIVTDSEGKTKEVIPVKDKPVQRATSPFEVADLWYTHPELKAQYMGRALNVNREYVQVDHKTALERHVKKVLAALNRTL